MKYSEDFILKVNEIYHDIEGKTYENKHPNIFKGETSHWQRNGDNSDINLFFLQQ